MGTLSKAVSNALYGRDFWTNYRLNRQVDSEIQGWNGAHPAFLPLINSLPAPLIIDVGVWKGQSTIYIAKALKESGLDGCVISVDTFLGSPEHWGNSALFETTFGRPDLLDTFLDNVFHHRVSDIVVPLPQTSTSAAQILAQRGIVPGLVHVDASHDYESVLQDSKAYWDLLPPGGVMVGDDYHETWPGVVKAADEFAALVGEVLTVQTPKWIIRKTR